jgi:hypothetical protein
VGRLTASSLAASAIVIMSAGVRCRRRGMNTAYPTLITRAT